MKKLLLIVSIVLFVLSCNTGTMSNETIEDEVVETVELKEPKPVTNISHVINGSKVTVSFEHDGDGVIQYQVGIRYKKTGYEQEPFDYIYLSSDKREFTFDITDNSSNEQGFPMPPYDITTNTKWSIGIYVDHDFGKYKPTIPITNYYFELD